jgi:uncharacterized membrane protein
MNLLLQDDINDTFVWTEEEKVSEVSQCQDHPLLSKIFNPIKNALSHGMSSKTKNFLNIIVPIIALLGIIFVSLILFGIYSILVSIFPFLPVISFVLFTKILLTLVAIVASYFLVKFLYNKTGTKRNKNHIKANVTEEKRLIEL